MIRQNRAVPILLVLTFAFILYLGGCFDSGETLTAADETPTPIPTSTAAPVINPEITVEAEDPFFHTVESGDRLASIASKYNVTADVIILANPQMDPDLIIAGEQLRIPGAGTNNEILEDVGPDRPNGVTVNYVVEPGDTFGELAVTWTVSVEALSEANPDVDPSALQVNELLTIPPWGSGIAAADLQPRTTPVPIERGPAEILEHEVAAGDVISAIAEVYGVTTQQIVDCNGLPGGGNEIQVGDLLLIPPPNPDFECSG